MRGIYKFIKYGKLEGMVAYGCLLLAPVDGWWPSATWRAVCALLKVDGIILKESKNSSIF